MLESIVTRRIDNLGRLVIPKDVRDRLEIGAGDEIEFFLDGEYIALRKKTTVNSPLCDTCPYRQEKHCNTNKQVRDTNGVPKERNDNNGKK